MPCPNPTVQWKTYTNYKQTIKQKTNKTKTKTKNEKTKTLTQTKAKSWDSFDRYVVDTANRSIWYYVHKSLSLIPHDQYNDLVIYGSEYFSWVHNLHAIYVNSFPCGNVCKTTKWIASSALFPFDTKHHMKSWIYFFLICLWLHVGFINRHNIITTASLGLTVFYAYGNHSHIHDFKNCDLLIQEDRTWMNMDGTPLSFGLWNRGVLRYVSVWKPMKNSKMEFTPGSRLEPGWDGPCIAIMYMTSYSPTWKTLPCDKPVAMHWVCKKYQRIKQNKQILRNDILICCYRCLAISGFCFTYGFTMTARHNTDFEMNVLNYIARLLNIWSYHESHRNFIHHETDPNFNNTMHQSVHIPATFKYEFMVENANNLNTTEYNIQVYFLKEIQHTPTQICGVYMQKCDDGTCRIQSHICVLDFECSSIVCSCELQGR